MQEPNSAIFEVLACMRAIQSRLRALAAEARRIWPEAEIVAPIEFALAQNDGSLLDCYVDVIISNKVAFTWGAQILALENGRWKMEADVCAKGSDRVLDIASGEYGDFFTAAREAVIALEQMPPTVADLARGKTGG